MFTAGRFDELMQLLALDPKPFWHDQQWAAKVLAARGDIDSAIRRLEGLRSPCAPDTALSIQAEQMLNDAGRSDEACARYAIDAHRSHTHIATYCAIAKTYSTVAPRATTRRHSPPSRLASRWPRFNGRPEARATRSHVEKSAPRATIRWPPFRTWYSLHRNKRKALPGALPNVLQGRHRPHAGCGSAWRCRWPTEVSCPSPTGIASDAVALHGLKKAC